MKTNLDSRDVNGSELRPPGISLTRKQLTLLLVGVPSLFVSLAMVLLWTGNFRPESRLEVNYRFSVESWRPPGGSEAETRLFPSIVLTNPTEDRWRNVAIALNKQFYYYVQGELNGAEAVTVPLEHFVTKGGNITFRPATQVVERLTIFAQLPSGERAVFDERREATDSKVP